MEKRPELIIQCRTTEVPGTRIGQAITADLTTPIRRRDATIFRWRLSPARIPSIVRCRTTMSCTASLNRKRRLLSHGSNRPTRPGQSVCKGRWVAIRKENRTCYAQWEDCGPFRTDHFQYVFQNERPKPNLNDGAGLDVSPAVRDYLRLQPTNTTDWQFVEARDVPLGPWRSYGENNHFVIARRQTEQHLKEQKGK